MRRRLRTGYSGRMRRIVGKSRIYYPKAGDKPPETVACLFHPTIQAITKKTVTESKPNGITVQYGLCWQCEGKLKLDRDGKFKVAIDRMLCKRLEDFDKQKAKEKTQ